MSIGGECSTNMPNCTCPKGYKKEDHSIHDDVAKGIGQKCYTCKKPIKCLNFESGIVLQLQYKIVYDPDRVKTRGCNIKYSYRCKKREEPENVAIVKDNLLDGDALEKKIVPNANKV